MNSKPEISEPLLNSEKSKAKETIAYSTVFSNSIFQAVISFCGTMFHPVYSMVNAALLGHGDSI